MYQKITIVGNLGRDPEMKYLPDGKAVTRFSVATSNYKNETAWFRVSVFGRSAEACHQYLAKGSKVLVDGELTYDADTGGPKVFDRKDGTAGATFEVVARDVKFLSGGNSSGGYQAPAQQSQAAQQEDDIPF